MRLFSRKRTYPALAPFLSGAAVKGEEGYWHPQIVLSVNPTSRREERELDVWVSAIPFSFREDALDYAWQHLRDFTFKAVDPDARWYQKDYQESIRRALART